MDKLYNEEVSSLHEQLFLESYFISGAHLHEAGHCHITGMPHPRNFFSSEQLLYLSVYLHRLAKNENEKRKEKEENKIQLSYNVCCMKTKHYKSISKGVHGMKSKAHHIHPYPVFCTSKTHNQTMKATLQQLLRGTQF